MKVACCDRKMTASAGSIRALRLLRYSAFAAIVIGLLRVRNFTIAATTRTAASPASKPIGKAFIPCSCVTCTLHVTLALHESQAGVYGRSRGSLEAGRMAVHSLDTPYRGGF